MEALPDIKQLERQTQHYIQQDGLMDVLCGIILIAVSLLLKSFTLMPVVLIPGILGPKLISLVRNKYTFPRIGYAKLDTVSKKKRAKWTSFFLSVVIATCLWIFLINVNISNLFSSERTWVPAMTGLALSAVCIRAYFKFASFRFLIYFSICLGLGVYYSVFNSSPFYAKILSILLITGFMMLFTGAIVFVRFIKTYSAVTHEVSNG